jgi:hypothetical protein
MDHITSVIFPEKTMMATDFEPATVIAHSLRKLHGSFRSDQLAFLALTQKIEMAIRDALAFQLYEALPDDSLVCREYDFGEKSKKRIDLAIIKEGAPSTLIECKAIYTFDVLKGGVKHDYPEQLKSDVDKIRACLEDIPAHVTSPKIFTLLLATHPHAMPLQKYAPAVKYMQGIKSCINRTLEEVDAEVAIRLYDHPVSDQGRIQGGSAYGIDVSISYWLMGPY